MKGQTGHPGTPDDNGREFDHVCLRCARNLYPKKCELAFKMKNGCDEFTPLKQRLGQDLDFLDRFDKG
jgi:hypothetical protein